MKAPENWDWKNPDYDLIFNERIKRLEAIRERPEILPGLKKYYAENWTEFISDWMVTFDPRLAERGMKTVVPFLLFPEQEKFIDWAKERWIKRADGVVEKSRDMGASWLLCAMSVCMFLFVPGSVVGMGSRKESYVDGGSDPASLFWKIRQCIDMLPGEFRPDKWDSKTHAPFMRIKNPENGSMIVGEGGDNVGRGNRTSMYVVDEYAFFERPDAVEAALSQTSNCRLWVSTPNGAGNPFYRKAHDGKTSKFILDWRQDPRKDQEWYETQKAKLDPVVVAQEIDRNYESSVTNAFVPADVVTAAMQRGPADVIAKGGLRVGVDVARFGDDKTVITFRRGRVGLKQVVLSKLDVTQVAGRVRAEVSAYGETPEQIAVDTIGIGSGVADILRGWYPDQYDRKTGKKTEIVVDVNASLRMSNGEDYNLRAFMWKEMREWLKTASLPNDQDLKTDLTALRYLFKGGELLLESKDDAKRRGVKSPDRGDSLALTFAIPTMVTAQRPMVTQRFNASDPMMGSLG